MFEDKTADALHNEILSNINNRYDKTVGGFVYDVTRINSIELENAYKNLNDVVNLINIENLSSDELEQRIKEKTGLTRKPATKAIGTLNVVGNATILIGDIFETEFGTQFVSTENKVIVEQGNINIECTLPGGIGNVPAYQIKYMPITLDGVTSVINSNPATGGYEAESDESLLERYYERIQTPATSGNKYQYRNWAKEVAGVGDAKVIPLWAGDNTVKVIIINSNKQPTSAELVNTVQNYIDPGVTGLGAGVAPIGAYCIIESATGKTINITFTATKDTGITDQERQDSVEDNIRQYFCEIAFKTDDNNNPLPISYAKVGAYIMSSKGILDYTDLVINGETANIVIANNEVPVLGTVTIA